MIFVGDVAIARGDVFTHRDFPGQFARLPLCVNLEGAVLGRLKVEALSEGICNDDGWSRSFAGFRLGPVFLANNHILDISGGIDSTVTHLASLGLDAFGAGVNEDAAFTPARCMSGDTEYALIGAGWPVIGCKPAKGSQPGVCPLDGEALKAMVAEIRRDSPETRVVTALHWNYEFERYPQPGHRQLAMDLIDEGAYAVIGHHPHVAGPVERYRERTIVYSLGNWAFSYGKHFLGKLRFPEASFRQIAVELGENSDVVHYATFVPPSEIVYEKSELIADAPFGARAPFEGATHKEYSEWFRANRYKKRGLPVYYEYESTLSNWVRDRFVSCRQAVIDTAVVLRLKSLKRSG